MIRIESKDNCCGCTACEAVCPKDAITMVPDSLGFKYPKVDLGKCIDCDLCVKVCQFKIDYDRSDNLLNSLSYGVRHKKIEEVATSRSGAAFVALSDKILEKNGVVYGVILDSAFIVRHIRACNKLERDRMKGSKYVQSDLEGIFRQVKNDLMAGFNVLFSGTPCQIAGLKSYIGKKIEENLYTVDIVCHGVPSPYVWKDYLLWLKEKWNCEISKVDFRDKSFGWFAHKESYLTNKGKKYCNSFTRAFNKHLIIRDSCEICPYTNTHHPADITLADFWGWQRNDAEWNKDDMGLSLVLVNSVKGKQLFEAASECIEKKQYPLENCMQNQMRQPIKLNIRCKEFQDDYKKHGFEYSMKKFRCIGFSYNLYILCSYIKSKLRIALGK